MVALPSVAVVVERSLVGLGVVVLVVVAVQLVGVVAIIVVGLFMVRVQVHISGRNCRSGRNIIVEAEVIEVPEVVVAVPFV